MAVDGTILTYKNFADVNVKLHEAAERSDVDSADLITDEIRLEQHFRNGNVRRDSDDVSVWEPANRSNHLDLIVDGASAVSSFAMCSIIPWNMVVQPESTTWRTNSCGDQRHAS